METNKKTEKHVKRGVNSGGQPLTEYKKLQRKLEKLEKEYNEVAPFGQRIKSERIIKKSKSIMKRMGELTR